jgi:hypothetical protein
LRQQLIDRLPNLAEFRNEHVAVHDHEISRYAQGCKSRPHRVLKLIPVLLPNAAQFSTFSVIFYGRSDP